MSISAISALSGYALNGSLDATNPAADVTQKFAQVFDQADKNINAYAFEQIDAQGVVEALANAEMAMQAAVSIRDRVVGAYQELLRMPL